MSLAQGQYSIEVAQNPRRYFFKLLKEFRALHEEQARQEFERVNSLPYKLAQLEAKFAKPKESRKC